MTVQLDEAARLLARWTAEVAATKTMLERTQECFGLKPGWGIYELYRRQAEQLAMMAPGPSSQHDGGADRKEILGPLYAKLIRLFRKAEWAETGRTMEPLASDQAHGRLRFSPTLLEMRAVAIVAQNAAHGPAVDIAIDAILPGIWKRPAQCVLQHRRGTHPERVSNA
jgi:hypothetical protein